MDVILNKTNTQNYVDHIQKAKAYAGWLNAAIEYLTEDSYQNIKCDRIYDKESLSDELFNIMAV